MKAVIPAAGLGTRLLPATKAQPKEMLIVGRKPIIHHVVDEAVKAGITEIIIVTGRHKRAIEDYFDAYHSEGDLIERNRHEILAELNELENRGVNIFYCRQPRPLGLGDAILRTERFIGNEPFAVLLGDTLFTGNSFTGQLKEIHDKTKANVIGTDEVPLERISRYGVIDAMRVSNGVYEVKNLVEKPSPENAPSNLIIAARYILNPSIFAALKNTKPGYNNEVQLTDAMKTLLLKEKMFAKLLEGKHYDIGDYASYRKAFIELGEI